MNHPRSGGDEGEHLEGNQPSLASERTDLAWSRSGLSMVACGVLIARGLPTVGGSVSRPLTGFAILLLGVIVWGVGLLSAHRRRDAHGDTRPVMLRREVVPVAWGTAAVGTAAFLLAVLQAG